ncbi:hypothetical protein Q2V57_09225 [Enterobacter bugandensis]|uniref:hypothetical protein n=1 Tax=Enterobacter bugandensis TaxID=881260 RepID=UPI002665DEAE|nr:hypothetical protein [Enterobacter bugandensis]MDO2431746.1 hypothetical protein [Enterobacter bugandensis]MDO2444794.1 hypothetical protein [Enterobacter bugandensis]
MRFALLVIFLFSTYASKAGDWGIFNSKPVARFKVTTTTPYKEIYKEALEYYLLREGKEQNSNHFCMTGYDWPDGRRSVVLFWNEGNYIFSNWVLGRSPDENDYMSLNDADIIDQNTAVFTPEKLREFYTEEEIHRNPDILPMYGYRQKDVDLQRRDCDEYGEKVVIQAFARPKDCRNTDDPEVAHLCEVIGE